MFYHQGGIPSFLANAMSWPELRLTGRNDAAGRPIFELSEDYFYVLGPGSAIRVPAGFCTNFGTIPRLLAWIVSPVQLREAAIVHDWLCNEQLANGDPTESGYSRWFADAVLYEAMARCGFGWTKRVSVWAAVRLWALASGGNHWPKPPDPIEVIK